MLRRHGHGRGLGQGGGFCRRRFQIVDDCAFGRFLRVQVVDDCAFGREEITGEKRLFSGLDLLQFLGLLISRVRHVEHVERLVGDGITVLV